MVVLVSGAAGQLGLAIHSISQNYPGIDFIFASSNTLDITNLENVSSYFKKTSPDFCINAAAYTAVDKAESEPEKAAAINIVGCFNLALACKETGATLIHLSTDFVFDGKSDVPYTETHSTNPQGVYGTTKRDGEKAIADALKEHFIIRTSWLYSKFGNNFMKTMLKLYRERQFLNVVSDQIGTPTNAIDLAHAIVIIILSSSKAYGIYHFSNEGVASWYDFAKEIFRIHNISTDLRPIPTSDFPTPAKRPAFSVLDKTKIKKTFGIQIKDWQDSLRSILSENLN